MAFAQGVSSSKFHLPGMDCRPQENDKIESAPQSPPLVVDDPATPGCNQWEINVVMSEDTSSQAKEYALPLLDINYGIGDDIQLKYEVPSLSTQTEEGHLSSTGDSVAGIKYLFYENESTGLNMAIYPQVEFETPNSDAVKKGLEQPGTRTLLPIIFSKKLGDVKYGEMILTGNLAYNWSHKLDISDSISAAIGLGAPIGRRVALMGEISTEQASSQNSLGIREQLTRASLGVMVPVYKRILVFGSAGHSLGSSDGLSHTYFLAGLRL